MYLYFNMKWLSTNKGKEKVLTALIDNLLTPSGIPLTAYNMGHDNWDMIANNAITPTIEFKKEHLNLDPLTVDIGATPHAMILKEKDLARDNAIFIDDQVEDVNNDAKYAQFNKLKTKVLESDFTEVDNNVFFNLEEFQFNNWIYAVSKGTYKGSIFVTHPLSGGRLQLTPLTALVLLIYSYTKGYYGYELESVPPMIVRNIPKHPRIIEANSDNYPTDDDLWRNSTSPFVTRDKMERMKSFALPNFSFNSTTDFFNKTSEMFDHLEQRRALAAAEEDIFANGELELIVSKFYHKYLEIPPLISGNYNDWLNNIGVDISSLDANGLQRFADELILAGIGSSENINKSAERMHEAIINILRFFLSYTVQLVTKFTKTASRTYGLKTLRMSVMNESSTGLSNWDMGLVQWLNGQGSTFTEWFWPIANMIAKEPVQEVVGEAFMPLIDLVTDQAVEVTQTATMNFIGFSMMTPDELDPSIPYADPIPGTEYYMRSFALPDLIDIEGLSFGLDIIDHEVGFVDTLGLKEIDATDFSFSIEG